MSPEQIQRELIAINNRTIAMQQRYTGLTNMFNAACIENNQTDMENLRQQIHILVDAILDANATSFMLVRQLSERGFS